MQRLMARCPDNHFRQPLNIQELDQAGRMCPLQCVKQYTSKESCKGANSGSTLAEQRDMRPARFVISVPASHPRHRCYGQHGQYGISRRPKYPLNAFRPMRTQVSHSHALPLPFWRKSRADLGLWNSPAQHLPLRPVPCVRSLSLQRRMIPMLTTLIQFVHQTSVNDHRRMRSISRVDSSDDNVRSSARATAS